MNFFKAGKICVLNQQSWKFDTDQKSVVFWKRGSIFLLQRYIICSLYKENRNTELKRFTLSNTHHAHQLDFLTSVNWKHVYNKQGWVCENIVTWCWDTVLVQSVLAAELMSAESRQEGTWQPHTTWRLPHADTHTQTHTICLTVTHHHPPAALSWPSAVLLTPPCLCNQTKLKGHILIM